LFTELAEPLGGPLEAGARRREGVHEEAHRDADDDGLDAGLQQTHPSDCPQDKADEAGPDGEVTRDEDGGKSADGDK
jgi:hypothetical protein